RGERTTCSRTSMTCCRYPSESECPAWDAWANPVAEANDRSFTRFGIRRLWRVAAPHGPAFFPYESRLVPVRSG
ncbi:hypothetical protein TGPRC2_428010, partial [Toxoplasma gondii TgCatPRC2]